MPAITRPGRLIDKIAVVTGSSSGNGRAIALALAAEGATVVCTDVSKSARVEGFEADRAIDTDDVIVGNGGRAVFLAVDVTRSEQVEAAADLALERYGRLDIWVNNAGIGIGFGEIASQSQADLEQILQVNLIGTWLGCRAAISRMRKQEIVGRCRGRIVNVGSIAGMAGQPMLTLYSATKGAVHAITRQLAVEVAPHGINVNAIAPGYIPTAMTRAFWDDPESLSHVKSFHPWFELARQEDVAGPVVFLASDEAAFITGEVLVIDGGVLAG